MIKKLILFDLDGTLVDSAPQLASSVNRLRKAEKLAPLPYETLRPLAGMGARGLLLAGLAMQETHPEFEANKARFLADYEAHCTDDLCLFSGIAELLQTIENSGARWGIVTNKHSCFTLPILQALKLNDRACTVVSGDATGKLKPNPDNLLLALQYAGVAPGDCLYVGDDKRDALAARAAGFNFAAAAWGYLGATQNIESWQADFVAQTPFDLAKWLTNASL